MIATNSIYLKTSFLVTLLCLAPCLSLATEHEGKITQEACQTGAFDHTAKFGPDTNMGVTEFCWVHAIGALMEEDVCLENPELCGKNVSRSAVAALSNPDQPVLLDKLKMGTINKALQEILNRGRICLKEHTFDPEDGNFDHIANISKKLFTQLSHLKSKSPLNEASSDALQEIQKLSESLSSHLSKLDENHLNLPLQEYFEKALKKFPNHPESQQGYFFQRILLSKCDGTNLILLKNDNKIAKQADFFERKNVEVIKAVSLPNGGHERVKKNKNDRFPIPGQNKARFKELLDAKNSGRSAIFEVCGKNLSESLSGRNILTSYGYSNEMCGGHSIVVNGARWNEEKKQCELHMQNFWGPILPTAWYNADGVLGSTLRIHRIQNTPPTPHVR